MRIGGLEKNTLIDFPGRLSCTVFLTGCNFRCPFCYSKELVLPEEIKKQPVIAERDFFDFLENRKEFLEGVVLCGGEPTVSSELPQFVKKIKKIGYLIKLDTNGSNPQMTKSLINEKLIDYIAIDIKAPKEKYSFYSGGKADLKKIEQSINLLKEGKVDFEFRTTLAPGLNVQDIIKIADWLAGENVKYFLQQFNSQKAILNPEILKMPLLKEEEIKQIVEKIKVKFKLCKLR